MVDIDDCFSKHPMSESLEGGGRLPKDSTSSDVGQDAGKESQIPVILAKAVVAAKIQIVSGMDSCDKGPNRSEGASGSTQYPAGLSMKQGGSHEDEMVRNLKEIVADDGRWGLFAMGALGLQPDSRSSETLRHGLQKGFKEDTWDGFANLVALYAKSTSAAENADASVPVDNLSSGLIERTKLWLTFADYFENLFGAVREKNLPYNLDLYTDERLIRYLQSIGH
jgi:hypothetical protein